MVQWTCLPLMQLLRRQTVFLQIQVLQHLAWNNAQNQLWTNIKIKQTDKDEVIYSLFTPPTWTRQDKTRQSCLVHVGGVNTTTDKTTQLCLVSTQFRRVLSRLDPVSNLQVISNPQLRLASCKLLKTGSRQDKTVNCVHTADTDRQDKNSIILSVSQCSH